MQNLTSDIAVSFWNDEKQDFVIMFAVGIALAAITLLYCLCFFFVRCCCLFNWCPGFINTFARCCCGGVAKDEYSEGKTKATVCAISFLYLIILFAVGIGLYGTSTLYLQIPKTTQKVVTLGNFVSQTIDKVAREAAYLQEQSNVDLRSALENMKEAKNFISTVNNVKTNYVDKYNLPRAVVGWVAFCLPVVALFWVLIGLCIHKRGPSYLFALFSFAAVVLLWIMFAIHLPATWGLSNACNMADETTQGQNGYITDSSVIQDCFVGGGQLLYNSRVGFYASTLNALQQGLTDLKSGAAQYGISTSDQLPPSSPILSVDESNVQSFVQQQVQKVTNADYTSAPPNVRYGLPKLAQEVGILGNITVLLMPYAQCAALRGYYYSVYNDVCDPLWVEALLTTIGAAIIGCLLGLASWLIMARFNQVLDDAHKEDHAERQMLTDNHRAAGGVGGMALASPAKPSAVQPDGNGNNFNNNGNNGIPQVNRPNQQHHDLQQFERNESSDQEDDGHNQNHHYNDDDNRVVVGGGGGGMHQQQGVELQSPRLHYPQSAQGPVGGGGMQARPMPTGTLPLRPGSQIVYQHR